MKGMEIGRPLQKDRFRLLADEAKKIDPSFQIDSVEVSDEDLSKTIKEAQAYDFILVSNPFGRTVLDHVQGVSREIRDLGCADTLIRDGQRWWPRCFLVEGIQRSLMNSKVDLDPNGALLVTGSGASARATVYCFVKLGFKKIGISGRSFEKVTEWVGELERSFFDVKFEAIPVDQLVEQAGLYSVLVNTTPLEKGNHIVHELYYFNFLKAPGLVIDLNLFPFQTPLMKEARDVNIRTIDGLEIAVSVDTHLIKKVAGIDIDTQAYRVVLEKTIATMQFDLKSFEVER